MEQAAGTLYVIATPIGNLEDLSPRAARILGEVSLILAEDTRRLRALAPPQGFRARLLSMPAPREQGRAAALVEHLSRGESAALVTDAGTPVVSDPGARLVRAAREAGFRVVPIPGASAVTTALAASGLGGSEFTFLGFVPTRGSARRRAFMEIARSPRACVLFESPHRLRATLTELESYCGPGRSVVVARELTKLHEELVVGALGEVARGLPGRVRGEVTLVVEAAPESDREAARASDAEPRSAETLLGELLAGGSSPAHAAREAARTLGRRRDELYRLAVTIRSRSGDGEDPAQ